MNKEKITKKLEDFAEDAGKVTSNLAEKAKNVLSKTKDSTIEAIDANGDGKIDIEDIIILSLKTPGFGINRADFLSKELSKICSDEKLALALASTPKDAGIPLEKINEIADNVIKFERTCVTGISAALGTPGGMAVAATVPADIIQYYGYMLRTAQKLMYLYGFPEINIKEDNHSFDSATLNMLIICLGVMYGVAGANNAIKAMAKALAKGVEKKLLNTALTKGTIYPIVKSIAKWFGVNMTKQVFAGFFKKAIPVVGGVIGGGITYLSFKPCCDKLKTSLQNTSLSNPNYKEAPIEDIIIEAEYQAVTEEI